MTLKDRLMSHVIKNEVSGCWEWQGSKRRGYGRMIVGSRTDGTRRSESAHRISYEIGYYNAESNIERMTYIVIPETVGEYTGLTDKNGKKIFEGDIVKVEGSRNVYEVRWNETLTGYWYYRSGCFFSMLTSNCEVIGTIYDVGGEK